MNFPKLFNETCLNDWLLPNYTYFKIHDPAPHHDTELLMMAYEGSKSTQDNLGKFIYQFQPEIKKRGGARDVMVIVVGNGYGNMSSNPGWDWFHFT